MLPSSAESFRGSLLSGTIVCTNPTATSTRVNYSLIGDAISTFFFVVPGSTGNVTYFSSSGIATRPATTTVTARPLPFATGTSLRPGSRSSRAQLEGVRIVGTFNGGPAVFAVNRNSNAIATCR
jgi:hypothetical protein